MSDWDEFQQTRKNQEEQRSKIANWALLGLPLAAMLLVAAVVFWPPPPSPTLEPLTAARPDGGMTRSSALSADADVRGRPATDLVIGAGGSGANLNPSAVDLSRLATNIQANQLPTFQYSKPAARRGPRSLTYTVHGSGQTHQYVVGTATYGQTAVVGAANEWLVRPWWKPGWLTASADCGQIGVTSIAGHVSWAGRPGPFHDLGALAAGDEIRCQAGSGRWYTYTVDEVVRIDYNETDYYWRPLDETAAELTLFTCTPEISGIIVVRASIHPAVTNTDNNE